jgi:hypothetical protein
LKSKKFVKKNLKKRDYTKECKKSIKLIVHS